MTDGRGFYSTCVNRFWVGWVGQRDKGTKGELGGPSLWLFMLLGDCMGLLTVSTCGSLSDFYGGFPALQKRNDTV